MKWVHVKFAMMAVAAVSTAGCGIFNKKTPKTPVVGERIAVLQDAQGGGRPLPVRDDRELIVNPYDVLHRFRSHATRWEVVFPISISYSDVWAAAM